LSRGCANPIKPSRDRRDTVVVRRGFAATSAAKTPAAVSPARQMNGK
jgi:hypothetical protein